MIIAAFITITIGEDLTTEDMMSFYECSDFAFNFNLIVKLKSDNLTGGNIKDAVREKKKNIFLRLSR